MWKPKEEEKVQINEDEKVETEWDEVLAQATEEELVDLAGNIAFLLLRESLLDPLLFLLHADELPDVDSI